MNNESNNGILLQRDGRILTINTAAAIKSADVERVWYDLKKTFSEHKIDAVKVDASKLGSMDSSGGALLSYIEKTAERRHIKFELAGLNENLKVQLEAFKIDIQRKKEKHSFKSIVDEVGKNAAGLASTFYFNMSFIGKLSAGFWYVIRHPLSLRWKDTMVISELAGVNSFGICATIGTLFGLILAFQSATAMQQFGAEIYVASLVSLSLFRVLGPFIAAVLFSARSGSAFAAEIGTMKVNEEIDALVTMGIDPVAFLALPRVISGVIFVPLLAAFVNLFGLIGMFVVMLSLGYPFETIYQQTISITTLTDMVGGFGKSFVFGFLVAGVGCLRGLQTGNGSQAVGQAATQAVVSGIVLTVIAEGIFSVIFYVLGI